MRSMIALSALVLTVTASPGSLICEDPRLVDGGKIMHLTVVTNNYSPEMSFTADATQYQYGKPVTITVKAVGDRFTAFKFGVQVEFTGDNGQAQGYFSSLSTGLILTPNCATSVYAELPIANTSYSFTWTPHNDGSLKTTGNATFKLAWGNGPGNAGFMQIDSPALYMKTLSLWDPTKWNPTPPSPPAPAGGNGCMNETKNSFKGSPVFIQNVNGGSQTFQANRCIKCRHDQKCLSAEVICPTRPGMPLVERIWYSSKSCSGEPDREAGLDEEFAHCPGPEHYSPMNLNLTRFVPKLLRDQSPYFKDEATAKAAIEEYRRMLTLAQKYPEAPVVPSKLVDLVWHEHVLDTQAYMRDSLRLFGRYLHHAPSFGGAEEKEEMVEQQKEMLGLYKAEFIDAPDSDIWPMAAGETTTPGGKLPDCCSAQCAKPSCAGCVGCNAVLCGHFALDMPEEEKIKRVLLAPEQFAGYVATGNPLEIPVFKDTLDGYQCGMTASPTMKLAWSISNGVIYFAQSLIGNAWYGVGLNNQTGMAGGDYMVTMAPDSLHGANNYSGVKDMYVWGPAPGYPCWDIEYECSPNNATKGTHDLENQVINRAGGITASSWNRKLITGDSKDYAIGNASATTLFAWGDLNVDGDSFNYHKDNAVSCMVNFITGDWSC